MAERVNPIHLSPDCELAHAIEVASDTQYPIALDTGRSVYQLFVTRAQAASPSAADIEQSIAGIRQAAGSWRDVDTDAFNAYREERRRLHTRPPAEL